MNRRLPIFYSPEYLAAKEAFDTTRKAGWIARSLKKDPIPSVQLIAPIPVTEDLLRKVHTPSYVQALKVGGPRSSSSGFLWDPGMWTYLQASTGGFVAAAEYAYWQRGHAGSLSSGMHHARAAHGSAFCAINGLAVAAWHLLDQGADRILILDTDAHCGGGTHSIVRRWKRVVTLDVATCSFDAYTPKGRSTLDIVSQKTYLPVLMARLDALDDLDFDVVLYGAGMDPEGSVSTDTLRRRERIVFRWATRRNIPVAFCLLGGYTGLGLTQAELVNLHRFTIEAAAA